MAKRAGKPSKRTSATPRSRKPKRGNATKPKRRSAAPSTQRLARELEQARLQQAATAGVLKVISRSAFDLTRVLEMLLESAARLCGANYGGIFRVDEDGARAAAGYNLAPGRLEAWQHTQIRPGRGTATARALLERQAVQVLDIAADPEYEIHDPKMVGGMGTTIAVPLMRDGEPRGVMTLWKDVVEAFSEQQMDLVAIFADQAVIAIRNARLFEEVRSSRAALERAHERLQGELAEAAQYVRSLLPQPMVEPFAIDWRFVPSEALGGDGFGYSWIDPEHFALYLLDVCGHGIGPSLMSVAVLHLLRSASLRDVDFRDPAAVLAALNERYEMKGPDDLYFTLWYGVYQPRTRRLDYASAGHPPAAIAEPGTQTPRLLQAKGIAVGLRPGVTFARESITVPERSLLYVFSDGAFEIERPDGSMMQLDNLLSLIRPVAGTDCNLDHLFERLIEAHGGKALEDDFSLVRFAF